MARNLALVVFLVVAALAAYFFLSGDAAIDRAANGGDATREGASENSLTAAVDVADTNTANDARAAVADTTEAAPPAAVDLQPTATLAAAPTARVRGVVLRHDRSPAVGGELVLRPSGANEESLVRYGRDMPWRELKAQTRVDGSFEIVFEPVRGRGVTLELFVPWAPEAQWSWRTVEAGSILDLGTIVLPLGAQVRVDVVLPDGSRAPGTWVAYTRDSWVSAHRSGATLGIGAGSGVDGSILLERVAPGELVVEVYSQLATDRNDRATYPVVARAGEVATITHVHHGPAIERRLVVFMRGTLLRAFQPPKFESLVLRRADGSASVGSEHALQSGLTTTFDDIEPGEWLLDIDDARFAPLVGASVRTAALTTVELAGGVEIAFDVRAGLDGSEVESASFDVRALGAPRPRPEQRAQPAPVSKEHTDRHTFRTTSDPQVWVVEAPGYAPHEVVFESGFEPRSAQRIEVRLESANAISGRVIDVHGEPVADHAVVARGVHDDPPPEGDAAALNEWKRTARERDKVLVFTDDQGRFTTGHLSHTRYDLYTDGDPRTCAFRLDVAPGGADVDLVLAQHGRLEVHLDPPWPNAQDVRYTVSGEVGIAHLPARVRAFARAHLRPTIRGDGVYVVEGLPTGLHDLRVDLPGAVHRSSGSRGVDVVARIDALPFLIESGRTTRLVVDVGAHVPQVARVRIVESNRTGVELKVDAQRWDETKERWVYDASGAVGGDEVALVQPLTAGRWRFAVANGASTWSARLPGEYDVRDGETLEIEFEVPLVHGRIEIQDDAGNRLANEHLEFAEGARIASIASDDEGFLELLLPPGTFGLRPIFFERVEGGPTEAPASTFVWTESGPAEPVLVLQRPN